MVRILAGVGAPLAFACALIAGAAIAQAPHPIPAPVRPLAERAAAANVIALVRIERVEHARISATLLEALRGGAPARFEVKRSPLRPPPLEAGDRAVLFLRGARGPYVFAADPADSLRVGEREAALWRAIRETLRGESTPRSLVMRWATAERDPGLEPAARAVAAAELEAICAAAGEAAVRGPLAVGDQPTLAERLAATQRCREVAGDSATPRDAKRQSRPGLNWREVRTPRAAPPV